jgi:hypothetical protein
MPRRIWDILTCMRIRVGILVIAAGGAGITGVGCGGSSGVSGKDTGAPPDVSIPPGGVGGVVGSGGAMDTGGVTTVAGSGGAVGAGGVTTPAGFDGSTAGGSNDTALGGAGAVGAGGAGGAGRDGGAEARPLDAFVPDAPGTGGAPPADGALGGGGAPATGGALGSDGGPSTGGATGTGAVVGTGGATSSGGTVGAGGSTGSGGSTSPITGPCDIYAAANPATPCVAAYSMVRVLASAYSGPLYQLRRGGSARGTGGTTTDIGAVEGGFGDAAAQEEFCGSDTCTVSKLYDQSGNGNDLTVAPAGCYPGTPSEPDYESNARKRSLTVSGHKVYALYMDPHEGYRNNSTSGMPTGNAAQGIYELADGKRYGTDSGCCWEFGNATTSNCYGATGSVNALFFGIDYWGTGDGNGPWFLGDSGGGLWPDDSGGYCAAIGCATNPSVKAEYAFGVLKTSNTNGAIRVGNAQAGVLTTVYDGRLSSNTWTMSGGIILGIGADNSNSSYGTFFEGAIVAGRPSDATDAAIFANVQAAKYGQ